MIMKTLAIFNTENVSDDVLKDFRHRLAVRVVVFDDEKKVALLHAVTQEYYGLPGGGVDKDETLEQGAIRESKEEIGCTVEIVSNLGRIFEYKKNDNLINESTGYVCRVVGEKGTPIFIGDENEAEKGSVVVWVSLKTAIDIMKVIPQRLNLYSQYCIERDLSFLKEVDVTLDMI